MPAPDISIWYLLYEQTPPVLRWVLGVLTFGIFTLIGYLYKRDRRTMARVEDRLDKRIDSLEQYTRGQFSDLHRDINKRLDQINRNILEIVQNTKKGGPGD